MQSMMRQKDKKQILDELIKSFGMGAVSSSNVQVERFGPNTQTSHAAVSNFMRALSPSNPDPGVEEANQNYQKFKQEGNAMRGTFKQAFAGENPKQLWTDIVNLAKQFGQQFTPDVDPNISGRENVGRYGVKLAGAALKTGKDIITAPFTTTKGLLEDFGKDVVGQEGGMWDKMGERNEKYGPITNSMLAGAEGFAKGSAVAAAGAMAGKAYDVWDKAGKPMGAYVEPIQRERLRDPKTPIEQLIKDHDDYHRSLGTSGEGAMSKYHKDLTNRVGKELGFEDAVLDEDYANIWHKAGSKLDDLPAGKGPFRDVDTKPETVAEKEAAYRWTQKRTFNLNDQWDAYKRGVIKDLRRLGVDEQGIQMVKELPRGSAPREGFAQYLYKSAQLPATAKPILQAWQAEIEDAYIQFQHLSRGDTFTRAEGAVSPVAKMNENLFASSRSANGTVADALRETADLYEGRGDMGRATAYNRAADIITTKGAPNLVKLAEKGEGAIVDAFKGQGGIGQSIEKDIFEIMSGGSSEKLDALRTRVPEPSFPGPGAMSKNELVKPKYGVINYSASGWKHLIGKYDTEAAAKAALREAKERAGRSFITGRNPFEGEIVKLNKNGTFPPGKGPDF